MAAISSTASGAWNVGATWVGGVVPGAADNVTIATGHTVTSAPTMAVLDLAVNGTFDWSRSVSATLTLQRQFTTFNAGTWNMGTDASPIPLGVNHTVILNESNSATVAHTFNQFVDACGVTIVGHYRNRNAQLTAEAASGQAVIIVDDATGWQVGDRIVVASNTLNNANTQATTISAISGTTVTLAENLGEIKRVDTPVGNFESNLVFRSNQSNRASVSINIVFLPSVTRANYFKNVLFLECGNQSGSPGIRASLGFKNTTTLNPTTAISGIAIYRTAAGSADSLFAIDQHRAQPFNAEDIAIYGPSWRGVGLADGVANATLTNVVVYDAVANEALNSSFGPGGFGVTFVDCWFFAKGRGLQLTAGSNIAFINCNFFYSTALMFPTTIGTVSFFDCVFNKLGSYDLPGASLSLSLVRASSLGVYEFTNNTLGSSSLFMSLTELLFNPPPSFVAKDLTLFAAFTNAGGREIDTGVVNLGANSLRLSPVSAANKLRQDVSIAIPADTLVNVLGALRKNGSYGASNRPFVNVSGTTISTDTFTLTDSTDAWEPFALGLTSVSPATITFRVQAENTNVASRAYLADLEIKAFGYEQAVLPLLNPTIDLSAAILIPTITSGTATEAAAITGVSIDFALGEVEITAPLTVEQLINRHESQWATTLGADRIITATSITRIETAAKLILSAALTGDVSTTDDIEITVAGNYSATNATLGATSELLLPDGTSTVRGWIFTPGAEAILRAGATAANLILSFGQFENAIAGSGVTLQYQTTINIAVTGPANYYVAIMADDFTRLNTSDTGVQSGAYSFVYTYSAVAAGSEPDLVVRVRAEGFIPFQTSVTADQATINLSPRLPAQPYQSLLSGYALSSECSIDIAAQRIRIGDASISTATILKEFEAAAISDEGMTEASGNLILFSFAAITGIGEYLELASAGYRVIRDEAGDDKAEITGFITRVGGGEALLDTANGEVRFISRLGDWSTLEIAQIRFRLGLDGDVSAPVVNDPNLEMPDALGMADANLDAQLGAIAAQITERTLDSDAYFDPAADTVANVGTVATTTNLTNLPSIPNNWITAEGIATDAIGADELAAGAVTEIQAGLATTTQLNAIQGATFDPTTDSLEAISVRAETIDKEGTKVLRRRD